MSAIFVILPTIQRVADNGSVSAPPRVECVSCGGGVVVDLAAPRVKELVEGLAALHICPLDES